MVIDQKTKQDALANKHGIIARSVFSIVSKWMRVVLFWIEAGLPVRKHRKKNLYEKPSCYSTPGKQTYIWHTGRADIWQNAKFPY